MAKKTTTKKKKIAKRYLTAPLGRDFVRWFIPHSVQATDSPAEICSIYGVGIVTARTWVRILKGPQITRKGKVITKWEHPEFGSPDNKRKLS